MRRDDPLRTARGRVRLGPLRPLLARVQRPLIAGPLPRLMPPRLRRSDDPRAPALARAVESIHDSAIDPEEARWVERVERRRAELAGAGISTAYLGAGLDLNRAGSLITIERRAPNLAAARDTLASLSLGRADARRGEIVDVLDQVLDQAVPVRRDPSFSLTADLWRLGLVCIGKRAN